MFRSLLCKSCLSPWQSDFIYINIYSRVIKERENKASHYILVKFNCMKWMMELVRRK